jgi:glutaconate CoA-transferase subunit B
MGKKLEYNTAELVAVMSSRVLEDNKTVFSGAGLPLISSILAQKTHAPHLTILFEAGIIAPDVRPGRLPPSTNEARATYRAVMLSTIADTFSLQQRGFVDYGFLGAAQIDKYGNINTSIIGSYDRPKVRLPGSGGGNDIISTCTKIIIATHHEKRRFVEKVDFITSPGYLHGGNSREKSGLIFGDIYKVITHLAVMSFDKTRRQMKLEAVHPGVTIEEVIENTGFELIIPEKVSVTEPPTERELKILRELDPDQKYTAPRK